MAYGTIRADIIQGTNVSIDLSTAGSYEFGGDIIPDGDLTRDLGSASLRFADVNTGTITTSSGTKFGGVPASYNFDGTSVGFDSSYAVIAASRSGGNYGGFKFFAPGSDSGGAQKERLRIDSLGIVSLGDPQTISVGGTTASLQINRPSGFAQNASVLISEQELTTTWPSLIIRKNRGGNPMQADNKLGAIDFFGDTGSADGQGARIEATAEGTWSATNLATRMVFSTGSGSSSAIERMRLTSNGELRLAAGTVGIQFNGATTSAEALNDYEEGAFTPVVEGTTVAGTATYTIQQGRYTKIGDRVFFSFRVLYSGHTGTGNLTVSGLPEFSNAAISPPVTVLTENITLPASTIVGAFIGASSDTVLLQSSPTGGGALLPLAMDAAGDIFASGCYHV